MLIILAVSAIPDAITNIAVSILRIQHRIRLTAALNLGMAVVAVGFSWVFLPVLGIDAPGWGWLISQTIGTVAVAFAVFRKSKISVQTAGV